MRRRTGFLVGILFELLAIFGLFVPYALLVSHGTEITLRTVPVDPRSIFRGDYVMLNYEAGANVPYADLADEKGDLAAEAYIVLEKKSDTYERVAVSKTQPILKEGQVCLRGTPQGFFSDVPQPVQIAVPELSQYFVEEGLGLELQSANNAHRLLVNAVVSPSCMAVLKGVVLGAEVPASQLPNGRLPEPVTPVM